MSWKVFAEDEGTGLQDQNDADWGDGANFNALAHDNNAVGYSVEDPSLNTDFSVPEVTLGEAQFRVQANDLTERDHDGNGTRNSWPRATLSVKAPQTTKTLTDNDTNHIYISVDLSTTGDDASYVVNTTALAPSGLSLKVAEVDTSGNTQKGVNRNPSATFSDLYIGSNQVATQTWTTGNNIDHSDLGTTSSNDHHSRYSDSEARSAVGGSTPWSNSDLNNSSVTVAGNSVSLGGSTGISHADLNNIATNQHHSKTSSASELTDVSADSVSGAHHSKTSSASELTDVSADSASGAHHSRYSDSEARSAIEAGDVSEVSFSDIETASNRSIGIDDSEGPLYRDNNGNYAPLWNNLNVSAGNAIGISGGRGSHDAGITLSVNGGAINHNNLTNSSDSNAHHSRYGDGEARSAIEAGNLSSIDGVNNHRIRFDSNNSYVEIADQSNSRNNLVTHDTYINETGTWLADHIGNNSAHHSRYTDSEVRSAIEAGNVDHVQFSNTEDIGLGQIGRDNSIGFLGQWGSNNTAVLWDAYNVQEGNAISISGGTGNESNPQIAVDESQLSSSPVPGTLTDETSNRSSGTTYQNTTGAMMIVWVRAAESELSVGSTTSLNTASFDYTGTSKATIGYVPDDYYYELNYGGVDEWYESTIEP